ncbi:MAG TPA: hypothetical protein V6D22_00450 [Candidatus Obscuribacterales bacterium]
MKKLLHVFTTLLLLVCTVMPAAATTVYFSPDGGSSGSGAVETALPMAKLGNVDLPRGRLRIQGNVAEISVIPEWQFDRHLALTGKVLDTHMQMVNGRTIASGVIIFTGGEWIGYYDNPQAIETVVSGSTVVNGRITDVSDSQVTVATAGGQTLSVPMSTITAIRSPRVFLFSIAGSALQAGVDGEPAHAEARTVSVVATGTPFHLAALRARVRRETADGDWSTGKLVAVGTFLSLIEIGQLTPYLVVPLYSSKTQHQMFRRQLFANTASGVIGPP